MEKFDVRGLPGELKKEEQRGLKRKLNQSSGCARQGSKGLRRPKHPLSFQVSSDQKDGSDRLSTTTGASALENRIHLLNLIIRRNKNQHRSQSFFKHLCLLRSSLTRLLAVSSRLADLSRAATVARLSEQIRHNFEIEASLRSQKEFIEQHIREVLVPKCYVSFSGLVADSQFGNLGVVLVALLSEIVCGSDGVGQMKEIHDAEERRSSKIGKGKKEESVMSDWSRSLIFTSTRATGEDQGEVVERVYDRATGVEDGVEALRSSVVALTTASAQDEISVTRDIAQGENESRLSLAPPMDDVPSRPIDVPRTSKIMMDNKAERDNAKRSKKNQKRKNAIDDLFSGLL